METLKWLDNNSPKICYIESPTYPILLKEDYLLLKKLHRKKIPTGYFYRDFYRKFPDLFPKRKGFYNSLKEIYLDYMQKKTDRALKNVDIVYFPSNEATSLFEYNDMRMLPPAGENHIDYDKVLNHTCIYVGGISKLYGFEILIESFKILYSRNNDFRLILICRKDEWDNIDDEIKGYCWLEVHHASGDELEQYYRKSSIALMPKIKNAYNDLAISVKLYEYMSYGLPVIATSNRATEAVICEGNIGVISKQNPIDFADAIECLANNTGEYYRIKKNVETSLLNYNLWKHRVNTIVNDLLNIGRVQE